MGNVQETPTPTTCLKSTAVHLPFVRQYAPHLYRRTFLASKLRRKGNPAIRLPFVLQYASHLYGSTAPPHLYGSTFGKILGVGVTGTFLISERGRQPKTVFRTVQQTPLGRSAQRHQITLGARQKETANGRNRFLQKSAAVFCGFLQNLRFPAIFCANLRLPNPLIYRASRKSAKICKNLRKCAFRVRFLPFAVSLVARPDNQFWTLWLF